MPLYTGHLRNTHKQPHLTPILITAKAHHIIPRLLHNPYTSDLRAPQDRFSMRHPHQPVPCLVHQSSLPSTLEALPQDGRELDNHCMRGLVHLLPLDRMLSAPFLLLRHPLICPNLADRRANEVGADRLDGEVLLLKRIVVLARPQQRNP